MVSDAFDKLARPIQKWTRQQGWSRLRDIQARAIHAIIDSNADLILAASTAGGKTEAAFLPLISRVLDAPVEGGGFDVLYVGPLKALITDQSERLESICREVDLPVVPWHGDVSRSVKSRALKAPRGILLITPESLEALFIRRGLEIPRLFRSTRAVVIDELHSMLDNERGVQMRSLLTRLELAVRRPIRRIGLSATLGDMGLACACLRPDNATGVNLIEAEGSAELWIQSRGYISDNEDEARSSTEAQSSTTCAIASHLFQNLRGSDNLVFAGSRQQVEVYADSLRELCERERLPQEFYPHHANLSSEHRNFVECRLKDPSKPTTAVCTSTLELGIDIGDVTCVAQIGAPFSVAVLRQRLGRSGRREGQPAILRQYAVEARLSPESGFVDRLRLRLVRAVAMIELLLEGWCEPPKTRALHLSTLIHQILSVIAERGGASAAHLYRVLCREGPFREVTTPIFVDVLRALGDPETGLIEQTDDGLLLLGSVGEKLVEHYSFYAVFKTPEEYRLIAGGRGLGTLPVHNILSPGMMLIFSGRRWLVEEIDDLEKVIMLAPAKAGKPPAFAGDPGDIHDKVIERMFDLLENDTQPIYLDATSRELLAEARRNYERLGFDKSPIVSLGDGSHAIATRAGSIKSTTMALALRGRDLNVEQHDGFILVKKDRDRILEALDQIQKSTHENVLSNDENLIFEKYHGYLSRNLLRQDALSSRIDPATLPDLCRTLLQNSGHVRG